MGSSRRRRASCRNLGHLVVPGAGVDLVIAPIAPEDVAARLAPDLVGMGVALDPVAVGAPVE
jgi:hypothetical protein